MRTIMEGMRAADLEDLVLPLLSVDEYESKIDDSAVVLGFYVYEQGAAEDLNRFIQRSPVDLLDTEISPAPDSKGYYMVFIEILNNNRIAENVEALLQEISALTNIESWSMKLRGIDETLPFDSEKIEASLQQKADPVHEGVLAFLTPSDLTDARFEADSLILENAYGRETFNLVDFGGSDAIIERNGLATQAHGVTLRDAARSRHLSLMLGEGWVTHRIGAYDVLLRDGSDDALILSV